MLELGVFHNGAVDLPLVLSEPDGVPVPDASIEEVHESYRRITHRQVRESILAEQLGFNYMFFTEHHFQPEGAEYSPDPIVVQAAIASQTKKIRLGQMANILPWWHPVRLAEQAALLDVLSGGRLEFGIGRGYQPREAEVFGKPFGATVQDQERNRRYFDEAYQLILKCWTEPSFSHQGEFFQIPPSYTRWHHWGTMGFFNQPKSERTIEDVLNLSPADMYSMAAAAPLYATTTTLKELSVFPQPVQKPYPQFWEPVNSERSINWCVSRGMNCFTVPDSNERVKHNVAVYYEEAEKNNWPDRLNRGPWKYGWDVEKKRGYGCCRWVHIVPPGPNAEAETARYKRALEHQWNYYSPFGIAGLLADPGEEPPDAYSLIPADLVIDKGLAFIGPADKVIDDIMNVKEIVGYDDFMFTPWFEGSTYSADEVEEQMRMFAADVMPTLAKACGGLVENDPVDVDLQPRVAEPVS